jgi:O-antigen/teichoic acid export membrane protein
MAAISNVSSERGFSLHVLGTFGTRLAMIANSVVAGIVVARWLGADGVGKLAVINVSVATVVQLGSVGLPSANTYFIAKDPGKLRKAMLNSFAVALADGILLAFALVVTASFRPQWFGSVPPDLFLVAAISIPFQILILIGLNIFLAIGKVREFNLLDLIAQSFVLLNALVVLIVLNSGLKTLITLNSVTSILISLVIVLLLVKSAKKLLHLKGAWRGDFGLLVEMMLYGIKSHISIVAGTLVFRADLLVVNHFRGASEAGVYSVATQMATMLMLLPSVIATLLFPRITAEQDQSGETTCLVTRHTAFIMLICCLAAAPLSLLLPVFYGSAFAESSTQLMILLPGIYLVGLQAVLVQHFNALGLPKTIPLFWLATLVSNVVLVFVLVPEFGARGAALGSTISYGLISVLMIIYFMIDTRRSLSELFILRPVELRAMLGFRLKSMS